VSFSIVTVTLNAAAELALTMESVLQQDFNDFEYIVVDGGSWDDTSVVTQRYTGDLTRIVRMEDAGIYFAMNEAVRHCTKEYVIFMNAKDRFFSRNVLSKFWSSREGEPDFIFGDHVYANGRTEHLTRAAVFEQTRESLRRGELTSNWHSSIPCHQATFTRAQLLRDMPYDTRLEICADHDLMFRAYDAGRTFQYVDEIACFYMGGGYSAQRGERCRQEISYVYRRYSAAPRLVDRFFYGEKLGPFSPETAWTGVGLGGLAPPKASKPDANTGRTVRWLASQSFEVLSPTKGASAVLRLEGENSLADQRLTAMLGDCSLGSAAIPRGTFDVEIAFAEPIAPGSLVRVIADRYGPPEPDNTDGVSVSLYELTLPTLRIDAELSLPLEHIQRFGFEAQDRAPKGLLLSGWSGMEPHHTWSIGQSSTLMLSSPQRPGRLAFELSGNPHAPASERFVEIAVNGVARGRFEVPISPTRIVADLDGAPWEVRGANLVTLAPATAARPTHGGDTRLLGVCLLSLTLEP
jgi:hypothetical protein